MSSQGLDAEMETASVVNRFHASEEPCARCWFAERLDEDP